MHVPLGRPVDYLDPAVVVRIHRTIAVNVMRIRIALATRRERSYASVTNVRVSSRDGRIVPFQFHDANVVRLY